MRVLFLDNLILKIIIRQVSIMNPENSKPLGHLLVVDDNLFTGESMRQALAAQFNVTLLDSGEACLAYLKQPETPVDLILLDIEMDGIDGLETCRRLRQSHHMPIMFVSGHDELSTRLEAFDSGGDDFIVKPFDPDILRRKVQRMVEVHAQQHALHSEKASLHDMAMDFMKNIGDTGVLLNFMRSSLGLTDYPSLAQRLLETTANYGIRCHIQIRYDGANCTLTPNGPASPLEVSVLEQSATMGRIFQFSRRMVVNYDMVSVLILDLPQDENEVGRLRDNIAILAESAEAIAETIIMRTESSKRAEALQHASGETAEAVETLRELYRNQQVDTRISLQGMIDDVERAYISLGLTESQESAVSNMLHSGTERVLQLFDLGVEFDHRFSQILNALRPRSGAQPQSEV